MKISIIEILSKTVHISHHIVHSLMYIILRCFENRAPDVLQCVLTTFVSASLLSPTCIYCRLLCPVHQCLFSPYVYKSTFCVLQTCYLPWSLSNSRLHITLLHTTHLTILFLSSKFRLLFFLSINICLPMTVLLFSLH